MNRRPGLVAAAMLLVTFLVGSMAGMAVEEAFGIDWFDFLDEDTRSSEARLLAELQLTPQQRQQIDRILERREERLEEYWESRLPEIRSLAAGSYQEIRGILDPAQQARFDARIRKEGIPLPQGPD